MVVCKCLGHDSLMFCRSVLVTPGGFFIAEISALSCATKLESPVATKPRLCLLCITAY